MGTSSHRRLPGGLEGIEMSMGGVPLETKVMDCNVFASSKKGKFLLLTTSSGVIEVTKDDLKSLKPADMELLQEKPMLCGIDGFTAGGYHFSLTSDNARGFISQMLQKIL